MTKDIVAEAREAFALIAERESDNRREALDDLRFARLGEQWPHAIKQQRERDGRPCLTINRLPALTQDKMLCGACVPNSGGFTISLSDRLNGYSATVLQTMAHEMIHLWQMANKRPGGPHGAE
jgi:hypothetical protein